MLNSGLAYLYNNKIANTEHKENRDIEIRGIVEQIPHFSKIYFEITKECNRNCDFCNNMCLVDTACESCIKWKHKKKDINVQGFDYEKIIERISSLWVEQIVISGGNPFMNKKIFKDYVEKIRNYMPNVKLLVYTNGYKLNDEILEILYKNDVIINFMILVGDYKKDIKENIIYLNNRLVHNIRKCVNKGINCCFSIFGTEDIFFNVIEIGQEKTLEIENVILYNQEISVQNKFENRKRRVNSNYFLNQKFNSCLYNKLAITMDGFVRPCPMIDDDLLDLKKERFDSLFQKMLIDKYWRYTKKMFICVQNVHINFLVKIVQQLNWKLIVERF